MKTASRPSKAPAKKSVRKGRSGTRRAKATKSPTPETATPAAKATTTKAKSDPRSTTCVQCGDKLGTKISRQEFSINGETVTVPKVEHLKCNGCGEISYRFDQLRHFREKAFALYRKTRGLLSPDEIRSLRERHGLTQAQFAKILHVGPNTLSRWEANRNVQSASLNSFLEVIRDVPGALEYLESRAA